jgi:hypothetical protein
MEMDVEDGLPGIRPRIDHHAITTVLNSLLPGQLFGREKELSHDLGIGFLQVVHGRDVLSWDDEDMGGGLGVDVAKCHDLGVGSDNVRRNLSGGDSAE